MTGIFYYLLLLIYILRFYARLCIYTLDARPYIYTLRARASIYIRRTSVRLYSTGQYLCLIAIRYSFVCYAKNLRD